MKHSIVSTYIIAVLLYIILGLSCDKPQINSTQRNPNIVLITIDALRADHLSCYGYHRNTTPNIDKIAREGVRFTSAIATSSWTVPSIASIMTSLYPISHGVSHGIIKDGKAYKQEILSEEFNTLAETLKSNGYTTFGAVANVHMVEELGFGQGFDYYYCEGFDEASALNKVIFSWEVEIKNSEKYFLWVHYFDPHYPYHTQTPWINEYTDDLGITNTQFINSEDELKKLIPIVKEKKKNLDYVIAKYDSEINYADYHIGRLISKLELDKHSIIIITSDHGEEFLDHSSLGHGHNLYHELIHVPMIIKRPFSSGESFINVEDEPMSSIDIMPTILGIVGITHPPEKITGENRFEKKVITEERKPNYLFSELSRSGVLNTIIKKNWKYIYNTCTKKEELYNLSQDHRELNNLVDQETAKAKAFKKDLYNWAAAAPRTPSIKKSFKPDQEIEEKLKTLGYITVEERKALKPPPHEGCNLGACHLSTN